MISFTTRCRQVQGFDPDAVVVMVSPYSGSAALSVTVRFSEGKLRPTRVMRFCERAKGAA